MTFHYVASLALESLGRSSTGPFLDDRPSRCSGTVTSFGRPRGAVSGKSTNFSSAAITPIGRTRPVMQGRYGNQMSPICDRIVASPTVPVFAAIPFTMPFPKTSTLRVRVTDDARCLVRLTSAPAPSEMPPPLAV